MLTPLAQNNFYEFQGMFGQNQIIDYVWKSEIMISCSILLCWELGFLT